jgi:hypothetical protein
MRRRRPRIHRTVTEHDSKRIARDWNREIEDDIRRREAAEKAQGRWGSIVWLVLWLLWLVVVAAAIGLIRRLGW